ncbi:MAG: hypothetical protein KJ578_14330 [Bacteroidetes bacterium]|nr:hypothetical protein [Bacteroidota bacterium]MBU1579690.1 hypothetical protein [Bacteroidota bacterium]MBU2558951.1 hypothetical protein [Bacteroidota bacterium]
MKPIPSLILFVLLIALFSTFSCRKQDEISTDNALKLTFSADSVVFDTVFSSIGSATQKLMIYNRNNERLNISSIRLANGTQSPFRMNIDGLSGEELYDIEIAGNDSLFVFVRVTIDPRDLNNPFVVEEDLLFETNNNQQSIKLVAWGQDAVYILADQQINTSFPAFKIVADSLETTIWTAEKPYVVYGYALINSYGTLQIEAGARVYFHDKSGLWSFSEGQLIVNGTAEAPVLFRGDRLESQEGLDYRNVPGQWDRIWLMEARAGADHRISHAIIRNGYIGIQAESFFKPTEAALRIDNTIIENHTGIGLFSNLYAIEANNLVIANSGAYNMALVGGGDYRFVHTTLANNWTYSVRNNPALFFNNFLQDSLGLPIAVPFQFEMGNSIVYGANKEEFNYEFVSGADTSYRFENCLIKTERKLADWPGFVNSIANENPLFKDYENFDYRPDSLSPVIGKGKIEFALEIPFDLDGVSRTESPDLGAYQFVPANR